MISIRNFVLTGACVLAMGAAQTQAVAVEADFTGSSVILSAPACGEAHLRISSDDVVTTRSFDSCDNMTFSAVDDAGQPLPDGVYRYELTMAPLAMVQNREAMAMAQEEGDADSAAEMALNELSYDVVSDGGMFRVSGGAASAYDESVWEAEAQAEADAAEVEAEQSGDAADPNAK